MWRIGHWSLVIGHFLTLSAFAAAPETHPIPRPDAVAAGAMAFDALPPFVRAPQPPSRSLVPLLTRPWLPPAGGFGTPRLLPADRPGGVPLRPTTELPEVAATPSLLRLLRTGSPAFAVAPDAANPLGLKIGPDAASGLSPRIAAVPPAGPVRNPRRLPTDGQQALLQRPGADSPAVSQVADPFSPRPPRMLAWPLAVGSSPDVTEAPILSAAFLPKPDRASVSSDPTADQSAQAAIARNPELVRPPAPFLRLVIPDPFETITLVQLRHPLPDADPPSAAPGLPPRPVFLIKP